MILTAQAGLGFSVLQSTYGIALHAQIASTAAFIPG